jgi:cytochrome c peroxidase
MIRKCATMPVHVRRLARTGAAVVALLAACLAPAQSPPFGDEQDLSALALIGERMFFDASLSEPAGQSCASCHDPAHGFAGNGGSDAGVPLGADRRHLGLRNTPGIMYARFAPSFAMVAGDAGPTPTGGQFLDGRAGSLEEQADGPLFDPGEMANRSPAQLLAKLARAPYAALLQAQFGDDIFGDPRRTLAAIRAALAAFERSERFAPFSSKYDHVIAGDARFTPLEARSLDLFMAKDRGNCAACHATDPRSPDPAASLFTDFTYDTLGVPRNPRIPANADPAFHDLGLCGPRRAPPAADRALCGAFKVPTLRNVARRQAYMHNGVFTRLRDVVAFYATRDTDPRRWHADGTAYDDLPADLRGNVNRDEVPYDRKRGQAPRLDEADIDAIVAFLGTLSDGYGAPLAARVASRRADP